MFKYFLEKSETGITFEIRFKDLLSSKSVIIPDISSDKLLLFKNLSIQFLNYSSDTGFIFIPIEFNISKSFLQVIVLSSNKWNTVNSGFESTIFIID